MEPACDSSPSNRRSVCSGTPSAGRDDDAAALARPPGLTSELSPSALGRAPVAGEDEEGADRVLAFALVARELSSSADALRFVAVAGADTAAASLGRDRSEAGGSPAAAAAAAGTAGATGRRVSRVVDARCTLVPDGTTSLSSAADACTSGAMKQQTTSSNNSTTRLRLRPRGCRADMSAQRTGVQEEAAVSVTAPSRQMRVCAIVQRLIVCVSLSLLD